MGNYIRLIFVACAGLAWAYGLFVAALPLTPLHKIKEGETRVGIFMDLIVGSELGVPDGIAPDVWALLEGCTDYQRAWFAHYVGAAGFNAAEAARMAGATGASSAKNSWRMKPGAWDCSGDFCSFARRGISRERILERLAQVAFAETGEALDADGRFSAGRMCQFGLTGMVRKVAYHSESSGGGIRSVEFESPVRALELLGRATWGRDVPGQRVGGALGRVGGGAPGSRSITISSPTRI